MKKSLLGLSLIVGIFAGNVKANPSIEQVNETLRMLAIVDTIQSAQNMINWQVGDFQDLDVKMMFGGGSSHKEVTKEETAQNAIWLKNSIDLMGQNQVSEALISRADGKVLKLIVNGQEQQLSDDEIEIIDQRETSVTVPAGTFECMYVKAKITSRGQTQEIQMWANPIDVNIDGQLKAIIASMFGDITMELKQFGSRN